MPLTKETLISKINVYLEDRWRKITHEVPTYKHDANGVRSTEYITVRNDETLKYDERKHEFDTVPSEVDALLTAVVSSVSDAIIELIKSDGIDIGESKAKKMEVQ